MAVQTPHRSAALHTARPTNTATGSVTSTAAEQGASRTALTSSGTLRLRAVSTADRHIQWAEDVIDNEGMGKKSSKVCCIYHAPRPYDESSDESSSESDESDSDNEADHSTAKASGRHGSGAGRGRHNHPHNHDHDKKPGGEHGANGKGKARATSPNAYEKMPKHSGVKKQR